MTKTMTLLCCIQTPHGEKPLRIRFDNLYGYIKKNDKDNYLPLMSMQIVEKIKILFNKKIELAVCASVLFVITVTFSRLLSTKSFCRQKVCVDCRHMTQNVKMARERCLALSEEEKNKKHIMLESDIRVCLMEKTNKNKRI